MKILARILKGVALAAPKRDPRKILLFVHIAPHEKTGSTAIEAVDGHVAARCLIPADAGVPEAFIPLDAVKAIPSKVEVTIKDGVMSYLGPGGAIISVPASPSPGIYPNFDAACPTAYERSAGAADCGEWFVEAPRLERVSKILRHLLPGGRAISVTVRSATTPIAFEGVDPVTNATVQVLMTPVRAKD